MLHHRASFVTLLAACGLIFAGGAAAEAQDYRGDGYLPNHGHPYGYGGAPYGYSPYFGHRRYGFGYGYSPYSRPHHSYGKYLFHVKYKYPELDYGLRHSPSHYYQYDRPFIILPEPPAAPAMPVPEMDESSNSAPPIPNPELTERFMDLARAANGVVVVPASVKSVPEIDTAKRPMNGDGWNHLRKGDGTSAYRAFTIDAANDPYNSLHRIGYSLAAAMWDDEDTSVWAMRRAIRLDPSAIFSVVVDEALYHRLTKLRRVAINRAAPKDAASDDHFMLATLHVMLGDVVEADLALESAIEAGDESESARNLQAVIDAMIRQEGVNRIAAAISVAR